MRKRIALAVVLLTALTTGLAGGFIARPFVVKEGPRLTGHLAAVGYHPTVALGCRSTAARAVALTDFRLDQAAKHQLARLLRPAIAEARPSRDCQVIASRYARNLIVDTGEAFLVDAWQNIVELEIMRFHGMGTGATAAAEGNTALGTESTTALNPDSTRATGSLTEASASVFRSVGTLTFDATAAITEWGLFSTSGTGTGVLFSRVVFSAINVASGDSIQTTWDLTVE